MGMKSDPQDRPMGSGHSPHCGDTPDFLFLGDDVTPYAFGLICDAFTGLPVGMLLGKMWREWVRL